MHVQPMLKAPPGCHSTVESSGERDQRNQEALITLTSRTRRRVEEAVRKKKGGIVPVVSPQSLYKLKVLG